MKEKKAQTDKKKNKKKSEHLKSLEPEREMGAQKKRHPNQYGEQK